VDIAHAWLDAGALAVVFDVPLGSVPPAGDAVAALVDVATGGVLPAYRLRARLVCGAGGEGFTAPGEGAPTALTPAGEAALRAFSEAHVGGALLPLGPDSLGALAAAERAAPHVALAAYGAGFTVADVGRAARKECDVVAPAFVSGAPGGGGGGGGGGGEDAPARLCVAECLAECARSDRPDRLFTTVVVDEGNRVLGLVYSSRESVVASVREMRGIYFSRSRNELWRKGDTSGNYQELRSVTLDCDGDALLFSVRQMGAAAVFCHKGTRNCWGDDAGLANLERTLASRVQDAPPGSYTKRLFNDPDLLRDKLLEEAQELAEATQPEHVAAEGALKPAHPHAALRTPARALTHTYTHTPSNFNHRSRRPPLLCVCGVCKGGRDAEGRGGAL
jgi:phosphoribosyl-AMP cyclohydrolase